MVEKPAFNLLQLKKKKKKGEKETKEKAQKEERYYCDFPRGNDSFWPKFQFHLFFTTFNPNSYRVPLF